MHQQGHLITRFILIASCLPVVAAAVYAAAIFGRLRKELKIFSAFLFLSAAVQIISLVLWWNKINNMPLLQFYVAGGFFCLAFFYREVFSKVLDRRILPVVAGAFVLFCIINVSFFQSLFRFSSHTLTVESILIIIITLSMFTLSLNDNGDDKLLTERKSYGWINSGLFIYYTSNLLIFYFGDIFTRNFSVYLNQNTWVLHAVFSMIMYVCFIIALWKRAKN